MLKVEIWSEKRAFGLPLNGMNALFSSCVLLPAEGRDLPRQDVACGPSLPCPAQLPWTSPPHSLTSRLLETVAPLVVWELAILEGVARVEERLDTGLVLIQVDGIDLWVVKQEVIVHVQLVEHPAQGVLADGQDAGVKPCREKGTCQLPPSWVSPAPGRGPGPTPRTSPSRGMVSAALC